MGRTPASSRWMGCEGRYPDSQTGGFTRHRRLPMKMCDHSGMLRCLDLLTVAGAVQVSHLLPVYPVTRLCRSGAVPSCSTGTFSRRETTGMLYKNQGCRQISTPCSLFTDCCGFRCSAFRIVALKDACHRDIPGQSPIGVAGFSCQYGDTQIYRHQVYSRCGGVMGQGEDATGCPFLRLLRWAGRRFARPPRLHFSIRSQAAWPAASR